MRDTDPESEVALWCSIVAAWLVYDEKFLEDGTLPDEDERKMLGALIAIPTGVEDVSKLSVPVEVDAGCFSATMICRKSDREAIAGATESWLVHETVLRGGRYENRLDRSWRNNRRPAHHTR